MGKAKELIVKVIPSKIANTFIKKHHYSGKVVPNSQLHFGVFYNNGLHGAMSYGASMDQRRCSLLVNNTKVNEFIELNRLAFDDILPKNSESRAISISIKMMKKQASHIKWILSYADGCQCGDGTIYRASGFILNGIKKNTQIYKMPNGELIAKKTLDNTVINGKYGIAEAKKMGAIPIEGYQFRYIYFIDKSKIKDLKYPIIPFSKIKEMGISMYKGKLCGSSVNSSTSEFRSESGGAIPTEPLHSCKTRN